MPTALQRNLVYLPLLVIRAVVCHDMKLRLSRTLKHHEFYRCIATVKKGDLKLVINRYKEATEMSQPMLVYVYSPWKYLVNELQFWQLKLLWDHKFIKSDFLNNTKTAAAIVTKMIVHRKRDLIKTCTTPMGFKQIQYDMLGENRDKRMHIMYFDKRHIRQVIPLKIQMLRHYNHKFAYADVLFVAVRSIDDFEKHDDCLKLSRKLKSLESLHLVNNTIKVPNPFMVAEIFMRFRRDYAPTGAVTKKPGPWLVSTYKILNFNLANFYPEHERQGVTIKSINL